MIRIVKMTFREDAIEDFLKVFTSAQPKIAAFPGCNGVELLRDLQNPTIMMTYSNWDSPEDLECYRSSELFHTTWSKTKILFNDRPQAWSLSAISS